MFTGHGRLTSKNDAILLITDTKIFSLALKNANHADSLFCLFSFVAYIYLRSEKLVFGNCIRKLQTAFIQQDKLCVPV